MSMNFYISRDINVDLQNCKVEPREISYRRDDAKKALNHLQSGEIDFSGWVRYPFLLTEKKTEEIKAMAKEIQSQCDTFLVLGVGGSFMGAKAVIDSLMPKGKNLPRVLFAGYNFSGRYLKELLENIDGDRLCLCLISKSGTTTETLAAYGVLKKVMIQKYGTDEAAKRTYVITEDVPNPMRQEAEKAGSPILHIPLNIGGRYSVLTPVGLLPIAVAGINITSLLKGAKDMAVKSLEEGFVSSGGADYAIVRNLLSEAGQSIEIFSFFYPYLEYLGEWLKQLFGESEGKDGKGIFPASLQFSRDLHSMGQFLQEGSPCFFETFITAKEYPGDVAIPFSAPEPLGGKTMNQINMCAEKGVLMAHKKRGNPIISISMDQITPLSMGRLLYFFQITCALSALLSGVNPFDQPGVGAYKKEMKDEIKKLPIL